jgi:hypothetical protein
MSKHFLNVFSICSIILLTNINSSQLRSREINPLAETTNFIQHKLSNLFKSKQDQSTSEETESPKPKKEKIEADENEKYFIVNEPCSDDNCPPPHTCVNGKQCKCAHGFAHFHEEGDDRLCTYQQKKQLIAFFLEMCFASGMGHFYAGRFLYGLIKMIFILLVPVLLGVWIFYYKGSNALLLIVMTTLCFALITWHLVDLIILGMNKYKDGEGVPLLQWS